MKKLNWQILLGGILIFASAAVYFFHFLIFHDAHHIWIYLIGDIAFVPIEVLLVTLIIHRLLSQREKQNMLEKMNMVIGAFFSEAGMDLLKHLAVLDRNSREITSHLKVGEEWSAAEFELAAKAIKEKPCDIKLESGNAAELSALRDFLMDKRDFLLRLLQNPNLLEHDAFTDLLWAVFHAAEELSCRKDIAKLPPEDYAHLSGDLKRVYERIVVEWLDYMKHLQKNYPYLFSLAIRTNPFDPETRPEITQ